MVGWGGAGGGERGLCSTAEVGSCCRRSIFRNPGSESNARKDPWSCFIRYFLFPSMICFHTFLKSSYSLDLGFPLAWHVEARIAWWDHRASAWEVELLLTDKRRWHHLLNQIALEKVGRFYLRPIQRRCPLSFKQDESFGKLWAQNSAL